MKRLIALVAVIALTAGMALAAPTIYGSNGLINVISAENAGTWGVGFHVVGVMKDSSATFPMKYTNGTLYPEAYFAFNDMIEVSLASVYNYYRPNTWYAGAGYANGLFDTRLGVKFSHKMSDMFCLGVYAGYDIPTQGMLDTLLKVKDPNKHTGTIHGMLIPGFTFGAAKLDINVGIDYDLDKTADLSTVSTTDNKAVYPNMSIPFGLGFSYKASDMFLPFVEVTGQYDLDTIKYGFPAADAKTRGPLNYNFFVTPGVRVSFPFGLNFDAAFSYNLIDTAKQVASKGFFTNPDWAVTLGLSYAPAKQVGPKVIPTGIIAGKVTDSKGKALAATITVAGMTFNADPATGNYTASGIQITGAPVEIKAEMKGYIAKTGSVVLVKKNKKTPAVQDFMLDLKPIPMSDVSGKVINYKTGDPVPATLTFVGKKTVTVKTDASGNYVTKLDPDSYKVTVAADGYNANNFGVITAADGKPVAVKNVGMVKVKEVFSFSNINFAAGKAAITPEIETALQPMLKVLLDNPDLKVEIGGHTDAIGSKVKNQKLSQARADAVMAWLIGKQVKASMTAMGYGSSVPVSDNKTKAGRAANRRIEVKVVQ